MENIKTEFTCHACKKTKTRRGLTQSNCIPVDVTLCTFVPFYKQLSWCTDCWNAAKERQARNDRASLIPKHELYSLASYYLMHALVLEEKPEDELHAVPTTV
jgi:hypothetical protein